MCIINTFNYIYDSICFADNKIKLIDFTTKVELLENATDTSNANIMYNFDREQQNSDNIACSRSRECNVY